MNYQKYLLTIETIKNSIKLLDDNTQTKLKETILNDLTLLQESNTLPDVAPKTVMIVALEESLKLQAHYANILNQYDGGERLIFHSVNQWMQRLKKSGAFDNLSMMPVEEAE